jgi:hypothetical protein
MSCASLSRRGRSQLLVPASCCCVTFLLSAKVLDWSNIDRNAAGAGHPGKLLEFFFPVDQEVGI